MPRKKTIKGGLLSLDVVRPMVDCLVGLPPGVFVFFAETPDQQRRLNREKHFFKCVAAMMEADFLGKPNPDYSSMEKNRRREVEDYKWRFVAFYRMVRSNWAVAQKALRNMGTRYLPPIQSMNDPFREVAIPMIDPERLAEQGPLAVSMEMIRLCAIGKISHVFSRENKWRELTPRRINRSIDVTRKSRVPGAGKTRIANADDEMTFFIRNNPWWDLERQCYDVIAASKPEREKAADLDNYTKAIRSQDVFVKAQFRNEKNDHPLVEIWEGGYCMPYIHSQNGRGTKQKNE